MVALDQISFRAVGSSQEAPWSSVQL